MKINIQLNCFEFIISDSYKVVISASTIEEAKQYLFDKLSDEIDKEIMSKLYRLNKYESI